MRIAGASEPDVTARILRLGTDLRQGLAGALLRHVHGDPGIALEIGRDALTPFDLNGTIDVELALGPGRNTDGGRYREGRRCAQNKIADRIHKVFPPEIFWFVGQ